MINMFARRGFVGVLALIAVLVPGVRPSRAGLVTVMQPMTGVGWTAVATVDSKDSVTLNWDRNSMTLTETAVMKTNEPITITFTEDERATANARIGAPGALRFTLSEVFKNRSGAAWVGFKEDLTDRDNDDDLANPGSAPDSGDGFHPSAAHFHPPNPKTDPANYSGLSLLNFANPTTTLAFGNGVVKAKVGRLAVTSLPTHDIQYKGYQRRFDLTETPTVATPEPSTLVGASTGVLMLIGYAGRRRKRAAA
jgi:hypothetical protein